VARKVTSGCIEILKGITTILSALPPEKLVQELLNTPARNTRKRAAAQSVIIDRRQSPRKKAARSPPPPPPPSPQDKEDDEEVTAAAAAAAAGDLDKEEKDPAEESLPMMPATTAGGEVSVHESLETLKMLAVEAAAVAAAASTAEKVPMAAAAAAIEVVATLEAEIVSAAAAKAEGGKRVKFQEEQQQQQEEEEETVVVEEELINLSTGSSVIQMASSPLPTIFINTSGRHINRNIGLAIKSVLERTRWQLEDGTRREDQLSEDDKKEWFRKKAEALGQEFATEILRRTFSPSPSPIRMPGTTLF
jgi:hypothetical protein